MTKAIIFDMDGTMVDNMMIHHRAWQKTLAELGLELTIEEVKEQIHGINEEILARLFGDRFTPAERHEIAAAKEAAYREIFLPELALLPGLQSFLDEVHHHGIPMAIGTAAPPENVDFVLDNLGLRPYFQAVFHAESVSRGKPDPEVFLAAAAAMGVPIQDCLVFEDSVTGAEAARRAPAPAVIITTTHALEEFAHFDHITAFLTDYQGVTWGDGSVKVGGIEDLRI
jgi:beta-phosphoglucomutase family hydrolase